MSVSSDDAASVSWFQPVYVEKPTPKILEQFAVCKHCKDIRLNHVGEEEKCLFDASTFAVLLSRNSKR